MHTNKHMVKWKTEDKQTPQISWSLHSSHLHSSTYSPLTSLHLSPCQVYNRQLKRDATLSWAQKNINKEEECFREHTMAVLQKGWGPWNLLLGRVRYLQQWPKWKDWACCVCAAVKWHHIIKFKWLYFKHGVIAQSFIGMESFWNDICWHETYS